MKGKKITDMSPWFVINSLLDGFGGMAFESYEEKLERKVARTIDTKYGLVDTCFCNDTELYETAILSPHYNSNGWIVVEEYKTRKAASSGHKKWVNQLEKKAKLWSIHTDEWYEYESN